MPPSSSPIDLLWLIRIRRNTIQRTEDLFLSLRDTTAANPASSTILKRTVGVDVLVTLTCSHASAAHSGLDMPPLPVQSQQRTNNASQGNGHRKSASMNPQDRNRRKNLAPRFQDDQANEGESDSYGTLNPNFQFGAKRRPTTNSISFSNHTPSQSLGGGGFVPQLGMTSEQMLIQQQIESLQNQQRALIQNQSQFVQQYDQQTLNSRMNPAGNNHRRIQSQQVPNMRMSGGNLGQYSPQSPNLFNPQGSPQMKNIPPKGHGRRHSVNVSKVTQDLNDFSFPPRNPVGNIPTQGGHGRRISTGQGECQCFYGRCTQN